MLLITCSFSYIYADTTNDKLQEEAAECFSKAGVLDSTLYLTANDQFVKADFEKKKELISYVLKYSNSNRAIVESQNTTCLWLMNNGDLTSYEMNTNKSLLNDYNFAQVDRLGDEKWFVSFGGEISYSSDFSLSFNGRVGTYLWKRFLDAGVGLNVGMSAATGDEDEDATFNMSTNLTSRLYFTRFFTKWPVSPFVGIGVGYTISPESSFEPLGTAGFNWYLTKGSIDFSIQYGKSSKFGLSAGYTISF